MTAKVTFDGAPAEGFINFGVGQPSADLLPVDIIRAASEDFLAQAEPFELNYGEVQGDGRFREVLAGFLTAAYGVDSAPDGLFLSAGNSQAMDFVCQQLTRPGDTVFVEEPSYFLAFQVFRDHGLNIVGIPVDEHGMDMDQLRVNLELYSPVLVYTIPSYHNPSGCTLSQSRREQLVTLSRQHDFVIMADEVYQLLYFGEPPPPALGTMISQGNVVSLGSFSKILAPGLRLGWIQTSAELMEKLLASGSLNSGGAFNHVTSHIVRHAITLGLLDAHILHLRAAYRARAEAMDAALHQHFNGRARWHKPGGGYFFWMEMAPETDSALLKQRAKDFRTGFQPGTLFSSHGQLDHCLRLSFAHYDEQQIAEGVDRLARLLNS